MSAITFVVPAVPVAQPRQRHRIIHSGGRSFAQNYTSAKDPVQAFKATIRLSAREAYSGPPLDQPLSMRLVFVMPRPDKLRWKSRPMPRVPFCNKNKDWDNLGKAVSDALNELIYVDDGLLWKVEIEKWFASGDEQPHVAVTITPTEAA